MEERAWESQRRQEGDKQALILQTKWWVPHTVIRVAVIADYLLWLEMSHNLLSRCCFPIIQMKVLKVTQVNKHI